MNTHTENIRRAWEERQHRLGSNLRSVLCKNLPSWMNESLHHRHTQFVVTHLPSHGHRLLDVGCGYGRISRQVKQAHPDILIEGVDVCDGFARQFENEFLGCFHGTIQDYWPRHQFDIILLVTVLMYARRPELAQIVGKLWNALSPGGRIICIEPYDSYIIRLRRSLRNHVFRPTGGSVLYFRRRPLRDLFARFADARIVAEKMFGIFPGFPFPLLHYGVTVEKTDN